MWKSNHTSSYSPGNHQDVHGVWKCPHRILLHLTPKLWPLEFSQPECLPAGEVSRFHKLMAQKTSQGADGVLAARPPKGSHKDMDLSQPERWNQAPAFQSRGSSTAGRPWCSPAMSLQVLSSLSSPTALDVHTDGKVERTRSAKAFSSNCLAVPPPAGGVSCNPSFLHSYHYFFVLLALSCSCRQQKP